MNRFRELARRLLMLLHRGQFDADLDEEMRLHRELREQEHIERGLSPKEAHYAVQRRFGNELVLREESRDMWGWNWLENFVQDVRYGLRMLRKNPGFTSVAVVTLALGIGANTTVFSWINSTLLHPIPGVSDTSGLVTLTRGGTVEAPGDFSYPDYADLREGSRSFAGLAASAIRAMDLTGAGKPERVWGTLASANYFDVWGVRPTLGRNFVPPEGKKPGSAPVVVISYALWQSHFAGSPSALGRTIDIDRHPFTIVGVAPPEFQGGQTGLRSDLWVPITMQQEVFGQRDLLNDRDSTWLIPQGRLAPGVSREQAQQEMNLLMGRIVSLHPDSHQGENDVKLYPLWRAPNGANAYFYILLPMLLAIAGVVLLLACANVANLLLVRAMGREREVAIRLSMGASRLRLVRQLLAESLLLALAGGGMAILITTWSAGAFGKFIPPTNLPVSLNVRANSTVVAVTLVVAVFTCVVFGLLPALRSSSLAPVAVLKQETGSASGGLPKARLAKALVVAQISLSLLLLICAGLFTRAFRRAQRVDPGFNPEHVLVASFDLFPVGYAREQAFEFQKQVLAKLGTVPGVKSVTLADEVPLGLIRSTTTVQIEGYVPRPHESMEVRAATVGPDYFRTLQIPLRVGRDFGLQDEVGSQPVAVVNQAFADRFWPRQEAIGKQVYTAGTWFTVIGVARNGNYDRLNEAPQPFLYVSSLQEFEGTITLCARVAPDPLAFAPVVEKAIHELDSDLVLYDVNSLASTVKLASTHERIAGTLVGAFGILALTLATVGIYGVIAYATRQRTREIGIRLALGARQSGLLRVVLVEGLHLTLAGEALGLVLALVLTRFLRSELFGVGTTDALTFGGVGSLLCVVALLACYIPARRATKVDPMVALRYE